MNKLESGVVLSVLAFFMLSWMGYAGAAEPVKFFWAKGKHFQTDGEKVDVRNDGIHDPQGSAVTTLQQPYVAMAGFPRDNSGIVDWVRVLEDGTIRPRMVKEGLKDDESAMFAVDFDIIFTRTGSMPNVRFPHRPHTEWLTCSNCHPAIFVPMKGKNPITMSAIIQGKFCGVCHGKVAFPPTKNCGRCHSVKRQDGFIR